MATPLDISLLKQFDLIFPFLLVFVMAYAGLSFLKVFKENKALHAIAALCLAMLSLFSPIAVRSILNMAPLFVILLIFILFGLMTFMSLGPSDKDVMGVLKNKEFQFIWWWIAAFVILIGFGSFFKSVADLGGVPGYQTGDAGTRIDPVTGDVLEVTTGGQEEEFYKTLFHPKILGLMFMILLGLFTINRLSSGMA